MAGTVFQLVIPPGANVNTIRAGSPVLTTAVAFEPRTTPLQTIIVEKIPFAGTQQPDYLTKDPIFQLQSSRNAVVAPIPASFHVDKTGDFTGVVDRISVKRLHPLEQARHRNVHKRLIEDAIIKQGPKVSLGLGLNGHYVYSRPRVKPWAPIGRTDLPSDTVPVTMEASYLDTTMPISVPANLRAEEFYANNDDGENLPVDTRDTIQVTLPRQVSPTSTPPKPEDAKNGFSVLFIVAAVVVGFALLSRAN